MSQKLPSILVKILILHKANVTLSSMTLLLLQSLINASVRRRGG